MRVITGSARGRRLLTLPGNDTRPTTDKVKEGLFSAVQFELDGRRVLDLFAGSGALGIEALSRGADSCVFVDSNRAAADVIRKNLTAAGLSGRGTVLCADAQSILLREDRYDAVLVDPPYASGLAAQLLPQIVARLAPGGWIACETADGADMPAVCGPATLSKSYRYGKTRVWLYRYSVSEEAPI
ncbi:MAG: 16S rRNA (guanine(966)-N(2))-methyltransferase RsmD [Clostridia bacterium]|nr:16S rRNA (guanine(966)-N(2))-methyltransferase RsmD [Clostridia bacterium]MBR7092169.1 16S rRNA (guanine(966)-N(2))-methyltransferase RsmD [Clostridia bacterium]